MDLDGFIFFFHSYKHPDEDSQERAQGDKRMLTFAAD